MTKAIALLPPRDRELITFTADGLSHQEIAARIGGTPDAARKAATRAIERLRKTYAIVTAPRGDSEASGDDQ